MKQALFVFTLSILMLIAIMLIPTKSAYPGSNFFYIKRAQEEMKYLTLINADKKAEFYIDSLNTRLDEISYLHSKRQYDAILSASLRYSATAGKLVEMVNKNNLTERSKETKELFKKHKEKMTELTNNYPVNDIDDRWKYLSEAMNYLDIYENELP